MMESKVSMSFDIAFLFYLGKGVVETRRQEVLLDSKSSSNTLCACGPIDMDKRILSMSDNPRWRRVARALFRWTVLMETKS